jgi:hypothetical protein
MRNRSRKGLICVHICGCAETRTLAHYEPARRLKKTSESVSVPSAVLCSIIPFHWAPAAGTKSG